MSVRRIFIIAVAFSILATPLSADAQRPGKVHRIGYLVLSPLAETPSPERAALLEGLRELGYVD